MSEHRGPPGSVEATVLDIITGDSYVVTLAEGMTETITFSLNSDVWQESEMPTSGSLVILQNIRPYRGGLRAHHAKFKPYVPK